MRTFSKRTSIGIGVTANKGEYTPPVANTFKQTDGNVFKQTDGSDFIQT